MGYLPRAAAVLLVALAAFFAIRLALGPNYLGLFNPDRTQDLAAQAARPVNYLDAEVCSSCHSDQEATLRSGVHQQVSCESCHGPGAAHVASGVSLAIEEPRELCVLCHASLPARPASHPQVVVEEHAGALTCTTCHSAHSPAQVGSVEPDGTPTLTPLPTVGETPVPTQTPPLPGPPAVPHSLEGRPDCTLCHGPAGIKPFPASHVGRLSETCLLCHQRQGGG